MLIIFSMVNDGGHIFLLLINNRLLYIFDSKPFRAKLLMIQAAVNYLKSTFQIIFEKKIYKNILR